MSCSFAQEWKAWIGVLGTSITLFANLNSILDLADWASELVRHWQDWNHLIWQLAFGWTGVKLEREAVLIISFTVFVTLLGIATRLAARDIEGLVTSQLSTEKAAKLQIFAVGVILYLAMFRLVLLLSYMLPPENESIVNAFTAVLVLGVPLGYLLYSCKERVWVSIAAMLFWIMGECLK
jgi:hypothetical protein